MLYQQSEATAAQRRIPIYLVDATDGYSPETGVTSPTIYVTKNGGTPATGGGCWTEPSSSNTPGLYYYEATSGELDTLGFIVVRVIKTGTSREFVAMHQVVPFDPYSATNLGLSNLDATISSRSSHAAADIWSVGTRSLTDKAGFSISGTITTLDSLKSSLESTHGAGSWATATGFSTHSASDVWSVGSRTITGGTITTVNDKTGYSISGTCTTLDTLKTDLNTAHGAGAWITATGFSTHSAADIWAVGTRTITGGTITTVNDKTGYSISGTKQTLDALNDITTAQVNTEVDTALVDIRLDELIQNAASPATPTQNSFIDYIMNKDSNQTFSRANDSLEAIRDRGDVAWITGGGGGLTQIIKPVPSIPNIIDLANTKSYRLAVYLINMLDDLPTTGEITPGTITIDRSPDGGTSWSNIINAAACNEHAGGVYYDEVFDSGSGYAEGDMIRITFKSISVTADTNTFEICGTDGMIFYTSIGGGGGTCNFTSTYQTRLDTTVSSRSSHTAADVWAVGTRALTDKAGFSISGTLTTLDSLLFQLATDHGASSWLTATGFATAAGLATHDGKLDTVDGIVDAILVDTSTTLDGKLDTIDGIVDAILIDTDTTIPGLIAALNNLSATDVANAVWDAVMSGHITANTAGDFLRRTLALVGKHQVMDDWTWNGDNNQLSCIVYLYDTKANAGNHVKGSGEQTGCFGKYTQTITFDVNKRPDLKKVVEDS